MFNIKMRGVPERGKRKEQGDGSVFKNCTEIWEICPEIRTMNWYKMEENKSRVQKE